MCACIALQGVQGEQTSPPVSPPLRPKQMCNAAKPARHVVLMSTSPELLGKMATQAVVHALTPEGTVQLLQGIVQHAGPADLMHIDG